MHYQTDNENKNIVHQESQPREIEPMNFRTLNVPCFNQPTKVFGLLPGIEP